MREFLSRRWHRLRAKAPDQVPPLRPVSLLEPEPLVRQIVQTRSRLERILFDNITPFWLRCIDEENGGYLFNHDERGVWRGPTDKHVIPHARTCWFFARLAQVDGAGAAAHSAARHGYDFLRDRLWDSEHGGFFWALDPAGRQPTDPDKRLFAQTFGLYAICEFGLASGDDSALDLALEVFGVMEDKLYDRRYGGYRSRTSRTWQMPTDKRTPGIRKTFDEHLHVLEALSRLGTLARGHDVRHRLIEMILILTSTVVRKSHGAVTDRHRRDWTPLLDPGHVSVSYGHDLEALWLVCDACTVAGLPRELVIDWARTLADFTCRWGVDRKDGGVYFRGPLSGPAHGREKIWWVQAEALVGFLQLYRLTGDTQYGELYLSTLERIERHHVDWEYGDWHTAVPHSSRFDSAKSGVWKTPYHNGRSMMKCIELLTPEQVESSANHES